MDVVVADIPPKFGVLLSRSQTSKLKGSLQMDMSYATIPVVGGNKRLYSEKISTFVVSSQQKTDNYHIHDVDTDLGSSIFFNADSPYDHEILAQIESKEDEEFAKRQEALEKKQKEEGLWTMYFDGYVAKIGAGVYIISLIKDFKALSYKLTFECNNNMAKYEDLLI